MAVSHYTTKAFWRTKDFKAGKL